MNAEVRQAIMKASDELAKQLAAIGDDDEYRHFIAYFLESLEGAHEPPDRNGSVEIAFEILDERLVNGRW